MRFVQTLIIASLFAPSLTGCAVAKATGKVAAMPVKGVYYTGQYAGKGAIGTAKLAGKGAFGTAKLAGKGVYYTGKGIIETGKTTVRITNAALDTTSKFLTVTTQVVDLTGKVVTLSKVITRAEMEGHIAAAKASGRVLEIVIDAVR